MMFEALKELTKPENFKVLVWRMMKILNELLQQDDKKEEKQRYSLGISENLIEIYSYIFKHLFKFKIHDSIILLKTYRMRWAKRITDHCFDTLRNQVSRIFNQFDLDKGFTEELTKKILRSYQKRNFTQQEIYRYMPTLKQNQSKKREPNPISSPSSAQQSSQSRQYPIKKIKKSQDRQVVKSQERQQFPNYSMPMMSQSSFIPQNPFTQPHYSPYPQNQHFLHQFPQISPMVSLNPSYQNYSNPPIRSPFLYPPQQGFEHLQRNISRPMISSQKNQIEVESVQRHKKIRYIQLLNDMLVSGKQCKECGVYFSTEEAYNRHTEEHFFKSKEIYEASHKKQIGKRQYLPNEEVINHITEVMDLSKCRFQVLVGPVEQNCVFCENEFVVSWSDEMRSWVYENAIETVMKLERRQKKGIAHYQCYEIFNKDSIQ